MCVPLPLFQKSKHDVSKHMSEHQTMYKSPTWCAPLSAQKLIHVVNMRADSPGFPHQNESCWECGDERCARSPPPICRKTREQRRWRGERSGVGVHKHLSRLLFLSLYPTHLVVLLPKPIWSTPMECVSALSSKIKRRSTHGSSGFLVRLLHPK